MGGGGRAGIRLAADERGAVAIFVALGMAGFLGAAALAVDLGMLMTARSEAQRAADGAALAGAGSLIYQPNDARQARAWAKEYASRNQVRGVQVTLRDSDIDVIGETVRVRVLRTAAYGGGVSTVFARMFGTERVDISAVAAAEVQQTAAVVNCLLPVALADRWINFGSDEWDPDEGDYYEPSVRANGDKNPYYNGYREIGELITLKPSQGGRTKSGKKETQGSDPVSSRLMPGFWDLWLPEGVRGVPELRTRVRACPDGVDKTYGAGDDMWRIAGNKQTLAEEFRLIVEDPAYSEQYYDDSCRCVRDGNNGNEVVTGGLRMRTVPVFDPGTFKQQGSGPHFTMSHFMGVFIEGVDSGPPGKANVYARVMPAVGSGSSPTGGGPLLKVLRLVQ